MMLISEEMAVTIWERECPMMCSCVSLVLLGEDLELTLCAI